MVFYVCRYASLPPNSINMLSLLIESKVRLPQCAPAPSRTARREALLAHGERDFFLSCVRDAATDLDLKSLSHKTVDNLAVLLDADGASLFLVDGPRGGRQTLVSKVPPSLPVYTGNVPEKNTQLQFKCENF